MTHKRLPAVSILAALFAVEAPKMLAQVAPVTPLNGNKEDETVVLSPFVIEASEDQNGYAATSTLAGTRIRTDLRDVATSISVVTKQFLADTNSHNASDLLVYTPNTEVGGVRGNFSGVAGNTTPSENTTNPSSTTRVRGLDAADNTRNFFVTDIPFDTFNTDRIDLQRGPNSILFGVGSPAGIINASLNDASFKTAYHVENVTSKYGSLRNSLDLNQVIIPHTLAIRFAGLQDNEKYQQKQAFNNSLRYYGALRVDPKIFTENIHSSFRVNYEYGKVNSNNPRVIPPEDEITPWFNTTSSLGVPALNKFTINEYTPGFGAGSTASTTNTPNFAMGRSYWSNPLVYFNGDNNSQTAGQNPASLSNLPTNVIISEFAPAYAIDQNGKPRTLPFATGANNNGSISGLPNFQPRAIAPYAHYANANLIGGSYYVDKVLTDPSVFDFFNNLLDGNTKHEWQNWHALDLSWEQTFFNDRVGYQIAYNQQMYANGSSKLLNGELYGINVDINQTLTDGSPNYNLGRPYVASGGGNDGSTKNKINRDSTRATAFGEFRASDFLGNSTLAKIIFKQQLTGLLGLDHRRNTSVNWTPFAASVDYPQQAGLDPTENFNTFRNFNFTDYLGATLLNQTSAANSHIKPISSPISPPRNSQLRWFDSHWTPSTNPADATYVNPNAVYTYQDSNTGNAVTSTQNNNPANYVGWRSIPITWLNASNPQDFPSLVTSGEKARFRDKSEALVYQGFWLNGDLALTYGWRKDDILNYDTAAPTAPGGLAALDYSDDPKSRLTTSGQTRTWGGVYHLPKMITKYLPWDSTLGVFYNRAHNFRADAPRFNVAGQQIPNPDGLTKEYGVQLTTLSNKISLKAIHYETVVHNATLTGDTLTSLGGLSYLLDLIPAWGYGYAAEVQLGLDGKLGNATQNSNNWNYAVTDALNVANRLGQPTPDLSVIGTPAAAATIPIGTYGYGGTGPVTMKDIVNAWLQMPVPDNFFDYYGITGNRPDPRKAHATGQLYSGFSTPADASGNLGGIGGQQPSLANSPKSTVDNVSKGWEFELTGQPTKNWNISVNYSRTTATKTNIDPATTAFMAANYKFYTGPGGQLRLWGAGQTAGNNAPTNLNSSPNLPPVYAFTPGQNNGSAVGPQWIVGVYNPYQVIALAQGQSAPEVSPWRLNLVTTYNFDRGAIKGMFVGGGSRIEAGRILAYGLNSTTGVVDVTKTFVGPNDKHFDLWVGYTRKIGVGFHHPLDWRIQLNFRNVAEKTRLVASQYEPAPDASGNPVLAIARIQEGMSWSLTNSFDF